jgi:hypothetical protein
MAAMQRLVYFLVLAGMLVGYYEFLGPGPGPSEFVEDLEWWRTRGYAHTWEVFGPLERLAEAGGAGALVPVGLFWLPPVAMLVWGFKLFGSAVLRTLFTTCFLLLLTFAYYGYLADRAWRFFEWRSPAVAATFAGVTAIALFAPSLLRAALQRSRVWTAIVLAGVLAGVFLLSTEVTGTDSSMRLNISPWPVVTLFGLLLIGSAIALYHIAAGLGTWLVARLGGARGLAAGVLAAGLLAAALTGLIRQDPGVGALVAAAIIGAGYALVRSRLGPKTGPEAARAGLVVLAAGAFGLLAIQLSNQAAIAFQKTARNETAMQVLVALENFRDSTGSFPNRLSDLVPDVFEEVPRPQIGLILNEDDEFMYRNLGDSYLLEFSSVQWVQCGYSPPYDVAKYSEEDFEEDFEEDEEDFEEEDEEVLEERPPDPELEALLADFGLDGAWNCEDAPPKIW